MHIGKRGGDKPIRDGEIEDDKPMRVVEIGSDNI